MSRTENYREKFESEASTEDIGEIAEKLPRMRRGPVAKVWGTVKSLWALAKDPSAGWGSKALAIGALVYLISPIDGVPDFIPFAGLTDDAAVIMAAAAKLAADLKRYQEE